MMFKKGNIPWNKGLTKETDERVKEYGIKISKVTKGVKTGSTYMIGRHLSEETKRKIAKSVSLATTGRKLTIEHREKLSRIKKQMYKEGKITVPDNNGRIISKETRAKISEANTGRKHSDETKRKCSISKLGDKNPMYGKRLSEEHRKKIKLNNAHYWKGKKFSKEVVQKMKETKRINGTLILIGENNPAWIDGRSYEPYTNEFNNSFKSEIKERDNFTCMKCGATEKEQLEKFNISLHVHHIDYNKKNTYKENCCVLCLMCNTEVNKNRVEWETYFMDMLRDKYGYMAVAGEAI